MFRELKNLFTDCNNNEKMMFEENPYEEDLLRAGITSSVVEQYGGEDQGSDYYTIWKFKRDGEVCYVKFEGWYQSFVGAEFEEFIEVTPKQKTITVFE